jgi:outer membrane phospholipase A
MVGLYSKSHWQIYNNNLSAFREVNYEPELILNFPVKFNLFGFKARMVGVALNHESNGKSDPFPEVGTELFYMQDLNVKLDRILKTLVSYASSD